MENNKSEQRGGVVDNVRIRLKIREGEFEAEGPDPLVRAHLAEFKTLLTSPAAGEETTPEAPPITPGKDSGLDLMYQAEPATGTLTLRILPSTDRGVLKQVSNTLLLILHGFHESLNLREVPVLAATLTIRQSGLVRVSRLSNAFLALQAEGLAMKIGRGKGTKYQLTAKGRAEARALIHNTLKRAKLASPPDSSV
jgi:hypothetical protein